MDMYSVISVEKWNLSGPSVLDDEPTEVLPIAEDFVMYIEIPLAKDAIVEKKITTTTHGTA